MVRTLVLSENKKNRKKTKCGQWRGHFLPERALLLESKVSLALYATDTSSWVVLFLVFSPKL